jgi:glycosyltransferase involved in cell wall biosynthesis
LESELPKNVLYTTSARIGGSGLDSVAYETLLGIEDAGILRRAVAYANRQRDIPAERIRSLRWSPVRLLSGLDREHYYGAKKHRLDRVAERELMSGRYDFFHGWSGECLRSLRVARRLGIPSVIEIPTWHRNKGRTKPPVTKSEREAARATGLRAWLNSLLVTRQQTLAEYHLADLILVLSQKAEETFLAAGIPKRKLFRHSRGVDTRRFFPAQRPPEKFVAVFVGALIKRKGVHHLIEVWKKLGLRDAELRLAGTMHDEIKPLLKDAAAHGIVAPGFCADLPALLRQAVVHIFPSECEGSAKCTYEAAACGLPQITTREAGDVVQDGLNGVIIPPNDPDALAGAILRLYQDRDLCARLGTAGRRRVEDHFTWEHFRGRVLAAYAAAGRNRHAIHP